VTNETDNPQLFVRLSQPDGRMLCLLPVGVAIEDRGHGTALVTQFHSGVIVGRWTVKGDVERITQAFEQQAAAMKTVLMMEAASPDSVSAMLHRLVDERMRSFGKGLDAIVASGVQKELRKMAGAQGASAKARPSRK